ncbi:MAG: hypothetical protein DI535_04585 [Citrobacter freundii]|nr:MAG: hypothetical protein DI535_04585 [Citrobacter freundii]
MNKRNFAKDILLGVAVGDALGVPVEFRSREYLKNNPVTRMIGFGSHHQPPGTWSDDSSLTFCLAQMLTGKYDLKRLATYFCEWKHNAYWSAHGSVFDIGISTSHAISQLAQGVPPTEAGGSDDGDNGNGSLMRILPLALILEELPIDKQFQRVKDVSSLTHAHIRSALCCFIYLQIALALMRGSTIAMAVKEACSLVNQFLDETATCTNTERRILSRILEGNLEVLEESQISSSGYVVSTLEAALWCLLRTNTFADAVLKAVNLGSDTDTVAAVTGGLAALYYKWESIPDEWLQTLAKRKEIEELADLLDKKTRK